MLIAIDSFELIRNYGLLPASQNTAIAAVIQWLMATDDSPSLKLLLGCRISDEADYISYTKEIWPRNQYSLSCLEFYICPLKNRQKLELMQRVMCLVYTIRGLFCFVHSSERSPGDERKEKSTEALKKWQGNWKDI